MKIEPWIIGKKKTNWKGIRKEKDMPKTIKFRDLRADELELRVGATTDSGFSLLIYKTARADANVLDETVGAFNWQKKFYQVKNTMICSLGINMNYDDETKEPLWIWKDDAGDESNTEAIKGEASDSFKRAGFAYGIARKLYNSPFIWLNKDSDNDPKKTHYEISEIGYDDTSVNKLVIINAKTKNVVFSYPKGANVPKNTTKVQETPKTPTKAKISPDDINHEYTQNMEIIRNWVSGLSADNYKSFFNWLENKIGSRRLSDITVEQASQIVSAWKLK